MDLPLGFINWDLNLIKESDLLSIPDLNSYFMEGIFDKGLDFLESYSGEIENYFHLAFSFDSNIPKLLFSVSTQTA